MLRGRYEWHEHQTNWVVAFLKYFHHFHPESLGFHGPNLTATHIFQRGWWTQPPTCANISHPIAGTNLSRWFSALPKAGYVTVVAWKGSSLAQLEFTSLGGSFLKISLRFFMSPRSLGTWSNLTYKYLSNVLKPPPGSHKPPKSNCIHSKFKFAFHDTS